VAGGAARRVVRARWNEGALRFYRRLGGYPPTEWLRYILEGDALAKLAAE
jgi:hypothetical protein